MTAVLVALGSNLGARARTLRSAAAALGRLPETKRCGLSRLHETEPVDAPAGSGRFLNAACLLESELSPLELLAELQRLEREHGRRPGPRNAPRTLDLDLILYGERVLREPELIVPHPRAHERLFVLEPAAEVAPDLLHPVLGRTIAELRDALRRRPMAASGFALP